MPSVLPFSYRLSECKELTGKVSSLLLLKVSQLLFFTIIIVIISALQYNKCVEVYQQPVQAARKNYNYN